MNAHRWTLRDIANSAGGFLLDTLHAARVLAEEGALALGRVFERAAKCPECGDKNVSGHADLEHAGDDVRGECAVFYGWAPKGVWQLDWSVPRRCDLPVRHGGSHEWLAGSDR